MAVGRDVAPLVNASNLWYGGDVGIEIVERTGVNLAFTDDDPRVDAVMTEQARKMDQAVLRVAETVYMAYGWDITSPVMVVGDDGIIIIDPPMSLEAGEETLAAFRRITDLPVRAIVYTHNHIDHVAAVKAFASEEQVAAGEIDIYAHETLIDGVVNWASTVGPIEGRRTSYTAAALIPKGPDGSVHDALGAEARVGTVTFIRPTKTFSSEIEVEVAGVRMHLHHVPSETDDEIVAWFPDLKVLHTAEVLQGENFPNLHTIRGTKFRDPVQWYEGVDTLRTFPADFMVPSHGRPVVGYDNIQNVLTAYRDAIQYVHDQTIRFMNRGHTPDELVELVTLPPHLADHPWLGEFYGTVKHSVRQIYVGYLGWFEGDPWALDPLPPVARASRYVDQMGGREAVLDAARAAISDGDYTWAAEILTYVIRVDRHDQDARDLKAEALRQFAYTLTNVNWRNWSLTAVAELEGEADLSSGFAFASPDVMRAFPSDVLLRMLTTRIDAEKSANINMTMGLRLQDIGEEFSLEIRRGVVEFRNSLPEHCDFVLAADRAYLDRVLVGDIHVSGEMAQAIATGTPPGQAALLDAINKGVITLEHGNVDDVTHFFSYYDDPVDAGSIDLVVR